MSCIVLPLARVFSSVKSNVDFGYALRDFLDRFNETRDISLISEEPASLTETLHDSGLADAYLAATAAWLANHYSLPVPVWAKGSSRALERPWFAAKSHKLRMLLLQESPSEFRLRNLFVSANALSRA